VFRTLCALSVSLRSTPSPAGPTISENRQHPEGRRCFARSARSVSRCARRRVLPGPLSQRIVSIRKVAGVSRALRAQCLAALDAESCRARSNPTERTSAPPLRHIQPDRTGTRAPGISLPALGRMWISGARCRTEDSGEVGAIAGGHISGRAAYSSATPVGQGGLSLPDCYPFGARVFDRARPAPFRLRRRSGPPGAAVRCRFR